MEKKLFLGKKIAIPQKLEYSTQNSTCHIIFISFFEILGKK